MQQKFHKIFFIGVTYVIVIQGQTKTTLLGSPDQPFDDKMDKKACIALLHIFFRDQVPLSFAKAE